MKITIHRGIDQIGGCITEIATARSRILIDLGQNLPDNQDKVCDDKADETTVSELTRKADAVFYTHYHGDHLGLFPYVPDKVTQYIGATAKEVALCKYKWLRKIKDSEAQPDRETAKLEAMKPLRANRPVTAGDITVTPYFVSHSAGDSYMFLIKAEGKRILHTGDFREHGYLGKGLMPTIEKYIRSVDILITEGTMLSRENEKEKTEPDLLKEAAGIMKKYKYVFVLCSSCDPDRLATFYNANPSGRMFICDAYQKEVLGIFTRNYQKYTSLYQFSRIDSFPRNNLLEEMKEQGFCMLVRANGSGGKYAQFTELALNLLPPDECFFIYSMWSGYLKDTGHQKEEYVRLYNRFRHKESLHVSGHAYAGCLAEVCNKIAPRLAIIPIHSEKSDEFAKLPLSPGLKERIVTSSQTLDDVEIIIVPKK